MILDEIAAKTRKRIEEQKKRISLEKIAEQAIHLPVGDTYPFEQALAGQELSFICEVKKASPSKGVIAEDFPYLKLAKEYEIAGAAAISCLTEPYYFQGSNEFLEEIAKEVSIPVLRKDFTVDEYMIYEAKVLGASAVLLICAILEKETLKSYLKLAHSLGLSALVETHEEAEVHMAIEAGARIIGVNNRDLKTFQVDLNHSLQLRRLVPKEILFVSESGISTPQDIKNLRSNGTNAVLIGESLMRSSDKKQQLQWLRFS